MAEKEYRRIRKYYGEDNTVRYEAVPDRRVPERKKRNPKPENQNEQIRRKASIARRNQKRAMVMNRRYVVFLSCATLICAIFCGVLLQKRSTLTARMEQTAATSQELNDLKAKNDALEKEIGTSVNLKTVKKQAKDLGMSYPGIRQIIYFSVNSNDYRSDFNLRLN